MIRLLLSDLRHHAGSWAWSAVIAIVAAAAVSAQLRVAHGALAAARAVNDAETIEGTHVVVGLIIVGVVTAAMTVLSSTSSLTLTQRERDHGLWKALGMSPFTVRCILLGQLLALGALASLASIVLGPPISHVINDRMISDAIVLPSAEPRWEPADLLWTALISAGTLLMGGRGTAKRASRTPEAVLLRGTGALAARRRGIVGILLRMLWATCAAAGWVAALILLRRADVDTDDSFTLLFHGSLSALILLCVLCRWLSPLLERIVARLAPRAGVTWHVAGRTCVLESQRSAATVLPFLVTIGLVAVTFGVVSGLPEATVGGFTSIFGLPFLVAWTGGVAVIAMSAGRRRRDAALLRAAGAMERDILAIEVCEGAIHAVAATAIGLLVVLATSILMAEALHRPLINILIGFPWARMSAVCGATLVTTCLAVVLSSRMGALAGERSPGQVLRAKD